MENISNNSPVHRDYNIGQVHHITLFFILKTLHRILLVVGTAVEKIAATEDSNAAEHTLLTEHIWSVV